MSAHTDADKLAVLVVEGDILVRWSIAEYLRGCGFDVVEAASGDEALAVLRSDRKIDIVFSEVETPGSIDGFALSAWVRENRPGMKVILAGSIARAAASAAQLCDDDGPLPKPYEPQTVLDRIRRLTGRADG